MDKFLQENFCDKLGVICDYSIHWKEKNGVKNPHAHVLFTTRHLTADGFGLKIECLNDIKKLYEWREVWAVNTNEKLAVNGHNTRIDQRSLKEQGIDLQPTIKLGNNVTRAAEKGIVTERLLRNESIKRQNFEKIKQDPSILMQKVAHQMNTFSLDDVAKECLKQVPVADILDSYPTYDGLIKDEKKEIGEQVLQKILNHKSVFNEQDLALELNLQEVDAKDFVQILEQIKGSKELVYLGIGNDGRDAYTTKACLETEQRLVSTAERLANSMRHFADQTDVNGSISYFERSKTNEMIVKALAQNKELDGLDFKLTDEQRRAVEHLCMGSDITCLSGLAGTGKTTVMSPVVELYKSKGYTTIGTALSNIAANNLKESGVDHAMSIRSLISQIKNRKRELLDSKTLLVVDEFSLVGSQDALELLELVEENRSKMITVFDRAQLQAVAGGSSAKLLDELLGSALLSDIIRQQETWQREASQNFAIGNVLEGLQAYNERGNVHFIDNDTLAKDALIANWAADDTSLKDKIIMAHERKDVQDLNARARKILLEKGELVKPQVLKMHVQRKKRIHQSELDVAINERVTFKAGGYIKGISMKIANNQMATILSFDQNSTGELTRVTFALDGFDREVHLSVKDMQDKKMELEHAYALTVHKEQGCTVKKAWVYAGSMWDRAMLYVAMTRHKLAVQVYASNEKFKDFKDLVRQCSRKAVKDTVLEYPVNFALNNGLKFENLAFAKKAKNKIRDLYERNFNAAKHKARKQQEETLKQNLEELAVTRSKEQQKRDNTVAVRQYLDANQACGKAWASLNEFAKENVQYWDQENDCADFSKMQHLEIYQKAKFTTYHSNQLADVIMKGLDRYQEVLHDFGVDVEILEFKQQGSKLFDAIADYKQGKNKLESAKIISEILENNIKHYPSFVEACISPAELRADTKEYQRQQYLNSLKGSDLAQFRLVEQYDYQSNKAYEAKKAYKALQGKLSIKNAVASLGLGKSGSISFVTSAGNIAKTFNDNFNLAVNVSSSSNIGITANNSKQTLNQSHMQNIAFDYGINTDTVAVAQKVYLREQTQAEELAYKIEKTASNSVGLEFFEFNNDKRLAELNQRLELELAADKPKEKLINAIEKQINFLSYKQQQIPSHATSYRCLLNVKEYARTKDLELALKIRYSITDDYFYNKYYFLARDNKTSLNDILQDGEKLELQRLNLTNTQRQSFNKVGRYVELSRQDISELSFDDSMARRFEITKLAHEILKETATHRQALEFYHIAAKCEEDTPKYQLRNRAYLDKQASVYGEALELINSYKSEKELTKKAAIANKLSKAPYYSYQREFLEQQFGDNFIAIGQYNDLIIDTKISYKEYAVAKKEFIQAAFDNVLEPRKYKPLIGVNKKGELNNISRLINSINLSNIQGKQANMFGEVLENASKPYISNMNIGLSRELRIQNWISGMDINKPKEDNHIAQLITYNNFINDVNIPKHAISDLMTKANAIDSLNANWTNLQNARNSTAHNLNKKLQVEVGAGFEVGLAYYELGDNGNAINEINDKLDSQELNGKERNKLVKKAFNLQERSLYIETHSNIHQCHLDIAKYKEEESIECASKVRKNFKNDMYGVCYRIAKSRNIDWNVLLTSGEAYDLIELDLSPSDREHYSNVQRYLELTRINNAKITYLEKSNNIYKQGLIACNILDDLESHTSAFKFYQIAYNEDDSFLSHEVKAFDKLQKDAGAYNKVVSLIEEYKIAEDETKRLEIVSKLNDRKLQYVKTGYLNSEDNLKDIKFQIYDDSIKLKVNSAITNKVPGASTMRDYLDAAGMSKQYWQFYNSNMLDKEANADLFELAVKQNVKRNELGYYLFNNKEEFQEILKVANIKLENLEKHSHQHQASLANSQEAIDQNLIENYKFNRDKHISYLSDNYSSDGLDIWSSELKEIIREGRRLSKKSQEIAELVKTDLNWLETLDEYKKMTTAPTLDRDMAKWANDEYRKTQALTKGSPAELYHLGRGIDVGLDELQDVRQGFIYNKELKKKVPVIEYIVRNKEGQIISGQKIFLRQLDDGRYARYEKLGSKEELDPNKDPTKLRVPKSTFGSRKASAGFCVNNGTKDSQEVVLCEGGEDAVCIWRSGSEKQSQRPVFSVLGSSYSNFILPEEHEGKKISYFGRGKSCIIWQYRKLCWYC